VYPLLELGIGFQPDFTVRDNLYIYGSFLGFSRKELNTRLERILEFAELHRFVDAKLDTLSSGMKVRLAFAIAMQADSSVYLVDEVLSVGDRWFQEKCRAEFRRLKEQRKTVVFVSHTQGEVEEFCDRVIILSEGKVINQGDPPSMIEYYNSMENTPS
jgi:ABC-type polysaccharide/polyol phosphate transport system ATPase subunit